MMPRPTCLEDGYEYRVRAIFNKLREVHAEQETPLPFEVWVYKDLREVGRAFLEDVTSYMGFPEPEEDQ